MKRKILLQAGLGLATALFAPALAQAQDLTVVGAGGVVQEAERAAYFTPFAAEKGLTLAEDSYSGQMAKLRAMVDSGSVTWDVVQMEQDSLVAGCEEGLFEPIDWTRIGEAVDFIPSAYHECGVGAFVWAMVSAYDSKRFPHGPQNWQDFWDQEGFPGKRGLRATAKMTLEIATLADGVVPEKVYDVLSTKEGQDRAFAKLDALKDNILWWTTGAESVERLISGDVVMTSAFNGRITGANASGAALALNWDGQVFGTDYWVIVAGSPRTDLAHDFIAFASGPEQQKLFPEHVSYGVTNLAAIAAIPPALAADLPTTPANMVGALEMSTHFWADNGEAIEARFANWRAQ